MEKIVKARKDHGCDLCGGKIEKGDSYLFISIKGPKYEQSSDPDDDGRQIGVHYDKYRHHLEELHCHWPEECKKGNHDIAYGHDGDPASDTCGMDFKFCENCGSVWQITEEENREFF